MTGKSKDKPLNILLVEDDKFDSFITQHYLKKGRLNYRLKVVHTGAEALDVLYGRGHFKNTGSPDLILADIGLPDMDGSEILKAIKSDPRLSRIPAIVLTGQKLEVDPIKKFDLFEHAYINKWVNMNDFIAFIKAVIDFRSSRDK